MPSRPTSRICVPLTLGPYRGAGRPEATYLTERLLAAAAGELGMDAAEIRRRNLIRPEDFPYLTSSYGPIVTYYPPSKRRLPVAVSASPGQCDPGPPGSSHGYSTSGWRPACRFEP